MVTYRAFFYTHRAIVIAVLGWAIGLVILYSWAWYRDIHLQEALLMLYELLETHWWGPMLFMAVAILRPFLLLPAALFTLLAGSVFGFWAGIFYVFSSAILSASITYTIGRNTTKQPHPTTHTLQTLTHFVEESPFMSVFTGHLFLLPFDVVNYTAGVLRIRYDQFICGTLAGSAFGIISFVSLGASLDIETIRTTGFSVEVFDYKLLAVSLVIFIATLIISLVVKPRHRKIPPSRFTQSD